MKWMNLTETEIDAITAGSVFRLHAQWPYEDVVDFMLIYLPSDVSSHAIIVSTGMKAGRVLVKLPLQADYAGGRAISKDWLVREWAKWIYPECPIENVLFSLRYEI